MPGLVLYIKLFAGDVGYTIDTGLTCRNAKKGEHIRFEDMEKNTYVFQTGAWDLTYAPLRNFIRNPSAAPYLLQAIKNFFVDKNCTGEERRLIWVSNMPYTRCAVNNTSCDNRGYRNVYANNAANQW